MLKRKRVLAAKVESVVGTAESLTATEGAFNVYDLKMVPSIEMEKREAQGSFNHLAAVPGQYKGKCTFKVDVAWDGTSTMPAWVSVLLAGCGLVDSSGTVTPRSEAPGSNVKTLTLGCYEDGIFKKMSGCAGNAVFVLPAGKRMTIEFDFDGVWAAPTDVAMIAPTYPTAQALRFAAASAITFNSVAQIVSEIRINLGNKVVFRESGATAGGLHSAIITDRLPMITASPEQVLVATQDVFGAWIARTEAEWSIIVPGPDTSTLEFSAPKAQIINAQEGDREGIVTNDIEWQCNKNGASADQELSLVFTETV